MEPKHSWRDIASGQDGLITLSQLHDAAVTHRAIAFRVQTERWQRVAPSVLCTTTGALTTEQRLRLGVLHGGTGALIGGIQACERAGLRTWQREQVVVLVPYTSAPRPLAGYDFVRTRRAVSQWRSVRAGVPTCQVEPAALLWASTESKPRTVEGLLAALVQQQVTTADALTRWLDRLARLPQAPLMRAALLEIAGGAHSVAELDVKRMCRTYRLAPPARQVKRRDADGRLRYTDCEWRLPDGTILVLEVDGGFHMDADAWADDIARQRALSASDRILVRCTSRELRDDPGRVARDLRRLGVPAAA
ncbi:MAG TPA: hypothetical protein VGE38_05565 [Nocardioides sp.]|uniref:hypothetical protein n=1 Tax=Nocardioides sp. TaxID=35761 RepID=UPI002EDAE2A2